MRLSGTAGTVVDSCTFDSPGGNGLMISGYNRGVKVTRNEFAWTGASAIVSLGLGGSRIDGSAPDFPEGTLIEGNLFREISVFVKQSGAYYHGVSANVTFRGNVGMNAARALVNINDGAFGGHLLEKNLLFNAVREVRDCLCSVALPVASGRLHTATQSLIHCPPIDLQTHDHGPINCECRLVLGSSGAGG